MRYIARDSDKTLVRMNTSHRWRSSKKNTWPQNDEEQIQPPGTNFIFKLQRQSRGF